MKLLEQRCHSANLECTAVAHKQAQQQFFQWFVGVSGYLASEVIGKYVWDLFLSEEVEPVKAAFFELQAENPHSFENYWLTKTGDRRLISWSSTSILDTNNVLQHYRAIKE